MITRAENPLMSKDKPRKRDLTRARVIQAAINCIYTEGFHAAHTNRIADQADVSWGVLAIPFSAIKMACSKPFWITSLQISPQRWVMPI